jgi:hypothetical protein
LSTREGCHDFLNIFGKKIGEKFAFLTQNKAKFSKVLIIALGFEKNANLIIKSFVFGRNSSTVCT